MGHHLDERLMCDPQNDWNWKAFFGVWILAVVSVTLWKVWCYLRLCFDIFGALRFSVLQENLAKNWTVIKVSRWPRAWSWTSWTVSGYFISVYWSRPRMAGRVGAAAVIAGRRNSTDNSEILDRSFWSAESGSPTLTSRKPASAKRKNSAYRFGRYIFFGTVEEFLKRFLCDPTQSYIFVLCTYYNCTMYYVYI